MEAVHRFSFSLFPISFVSSRLNPSQSFNPLKLRTTFPSPKLHHCKMDAIHRFSIAGKCLEPSSATPTFRNLIYTTSSSSNHIPNFIPARKTYSSIAKAGWFLGLGEKKKTIVEAGDPVLHEPAREVDPQEIGSEKIQKIIDDMVLAMRKAPAFGLSAPQIGIPLRIIVLEDSEKYISYASKEEIKAQDRHPFDLLVILNPELRSKSNKSALFFEGCLSVKGFIAVVERHLDVEVVGLDRYGNPIKVDASGWKARILQHECDHLDGTLYVDKMVPRTFRTVENSTLPLPEGCPKLGAC